MKSIALWVASLRGAMSAKGCALLRWFVRSANFTPSVAGFLAFRQRSEQLLEDVSRMGSSYKGISGPSIPRRQVCLLQAVPFVI